MIRKASEENLLEPLARRALQHRVSLYADVVIFFKPLAADINVTLDILQLFGQAFGLQTNVQKSSLLPIQCLEVDREIIHAHLPCQLVEFPCTFIAETNQGPDPTYNQQDNISASKLEG
jgi:hypothetical protein